LSGNDESDLVTRGKLYMVLSIVSLIVIVSAALVGPLMSRVEEPPYLTIAVVGPIEVRTYGPIIVAETQVAGERQAAISAGFRLLAAYIFGANKPNAKIAMTAPVQQQLSQTIKMTAPVTQKLADDHWTVRFTMPQTWTLDSLPVPDDTRVKLLLVPERQYAVLRFSGLASDDTIKARTAELRNYASLHHLRIGDEPVLAFYDPPWTLPFLRRNEVMLEIVLG
jgi:SOUL heme-binding protein